MSDLLMILGLLLLFIGFPASIVTTIVFAVKKKKVKIPALCIPATIVLSFICLVVGVLPYSRIDEYEQPMSEKQARAGEQEKQVELQSSESSESEIVQIISQEIEESFTTESFSDILEQTSEPTAESIYQEKDIEETTEETKTIDVNLLSEEEYKEQCKEIFYEDIKDKSGVSKGDFVKVETYVQQIIIADVYQAASNELWREHNLQLIYFECGALCREYENNYGGQNMVLFSKDYDIEPTKYQTGDCLVLFGEVIEVLKDGWTGRSNIYIIPKYVEKK